jgi:hypothetical protein
VLGDTHPALWCGVPLGVPCAQNHTALCASPRLVSLNLCVGASPLLIVHSRALMAAMSVVRVRVRAADAEPTQDVEVTLRAALDGWGREHIDAVANAVGVDTHSAFVSLRFAATGALVTLPSGEPGWRMLGLMCLKSGDVLVVGSGAAAAPRAVLGETRSISHGNLDACGGPSMPEEEKNLLRLKLLYELKPCELLKALQEVRPNSILRVGRDRKPHFASLHCFIKWPRP